MKEKSNQRKIKKKIIIMKIKSKWIFIKKETQRFSNIAHFSEKKQQQQVA